MFYIRVNDIFNELKDENKRLLNELITANKLLTKFSQFKCFIELISKQFQPILDENQWKRYHELSDDINKTIEINKFNIKSEPNDSKPNIECLTIGLTTNPSLKSNNNRKCVPKAKRQKPKGRQSADTSVMVGLQKRFYCEFSGCDKYFLKKSTLSRHKGVHKLKNPRPKWICTVDGCDYTADSRNTWYKHKIKHRTDRPYGCDHCDKRFKSKDNLTLHSRRLHKPSDTILICGLDDCQKQFKSELSLKEHQMFYHIKEQKYVCEEPGCQFKTAVLSSFQAHQSSHSDERPFLCTFEGCGKRFKVKGAVDVHYNRVHITGPPIKCTADGCEKVFANKLKLNRHLHIYHTGQTYPCSWPGCDYVGNSIIGYKMHQIVHSSDLNFGCDWPQCGKRFKSKKYLREHLRIHTNDKRYACSWPGCQYRCTDSGNIHKHVKQVHKSKL